MPCVMTKKPHVFAEIDRTNSGFKGIDRVVRWCINCGAVVVDNDVNGKTSPGDWAAMRLPQIALNIDKSVAAKDVDA